MKRTLLFALAFSACGPAVTGPTYASNIAPLVEARCGGCHVAGGVAPFPLSTYEQVKPMARAMLAAVKAGRMPPWKAADADVGYLHSPKLTAAQVTMLEAWANNQMPAGDEKAPRDVIEKFGTGLTRIDVSLKMPEPYTPSSKASDDYRCFVLDWPKTDASFITGFNALPQVPKQAHHIALYLVPPQNAAEPRAWDQEEAGPGYTCFGGPFGGRAQNFPVNLLAAWIPGSQGTPYPRGLGIAVAPGSTLVLQVHYNTEQGVAPDQTSLQFTLDASARRAAYQPFLSVAWVAGAMEIPAGNPNVQHQYLADPRDFFKLLGSPLSLDQGFNIEGVMFHMHRLGSKGELWLEKPDGRRITVLTIPEWDFHWQLEYFLDQPLRFEPGDKLRVRCTFDNSQGRQNPADPTPRDVNWGENSDEEMCVANLLSSE